MATTTVSELHRNYRQQIDGRREPFYGCFIQVGHRKNSPESPEPAYRVLRAIPSAEVFDKAAAFIASKMEGQGNVLFARYGEPVLIAETEEGQFDAEYRARRTKEILDEHHKEHIAADERFQTLKKLKHDGRNDEVREIEAEVVRRHNDQGWVKYMKKHAEIPEDVELNPGTRCELPVADASATEFEEAACNTLPDRVMATDGSQKHVAVTVMVASDDSMEAVLYLHEMIPKGADLQEAVRPVGLLVNPMVVDVVDTGEWNYPVSNLWTQEPDDQSWADTNINDMQRKRYRDAKAADVKVAEMREAERQREAAVRTLSGRVGLSFEDTIKICQTYQGTAELVATTKINDPVCREEALEICKRKYLNAAPPPTGIEQPQ